MGQPHGLPWEGKSFNPTRSRSGAQRSVPPALSLVNAQPSGVMVGTPETQHGGETRRAKEPMSPTFAQARECLEKFFSSGERTNPLKKDEDSFELIDMAEVEGERPLTEWPRQGPSKDRITVRFHLWGYRIYLPSKVLEYLKEQRLTERANFISMQLRGQLDGILSITFPGAVLRAVKVLGEVAIPKKYTIKCWDKIFAFDAGNGVILTAVWLTPLVYDLEPWATETEGGGSSGSEVLNQETG